MTDEMPDFDGTFIPPLPEKTKPIKKRRKKRPRARPPSASPLHPRSASSRNARRPKRSVAADRRCTQPLSRFARRAERSAS